MAGGGIEMRFLIVCFCVLSGSALLSFLFGLELHACLAFSLSSLYYNRISLLMFG